MTTLESAVQRRGLDMLAPGSRLVDIRGLRDGGSPWLLRTRDGLVERDIVLRVGDRNDVAPLRCEAAGLRMAERHGVAAPRLLAVDVEHDPPLVLTEAIEGTSVIPAHRPDARLRAMGAAAAELHRIAVPADAELPLRMRPIETVDFAALRARHPIDPLLAYAEQLITGYRPTMSSGFVHGDLWQGNCLWRGDRLVALVDWDCAGRGPAGVDLGSLRSDAALCFGLAAADDVSDGWEATAGAAAVDVAYWDIVAALSTPPDMGWFVAAVSGQGRADLTQQVLLDRRRRFLTAAIDEFMLVQRMRNGSGPSQ